MRLVRKSCYRDVMALSPFELNLRHLRALMAIRDHGSVSAASEVVSLSQPALTQGLAKLERQFGLVLFERRSDGMAATPTGEILADRVKAAFDLLEAGARGMTRSFSHPERLLTMTQLRAFLALADAGSFVAAGHTAGLSQTAIHRAVSELEQVVGGTLLERRGRGVLLNTVAKRLARASRLAVAEINAAIADITLDLEGTFIALGAMPLSRPRLVPSAIARLAREQPRTRFEIVEGNWRELVEPLRDGVIDMVVGGLRAIESADLAQTAVYEDALVVVAGSKHPLAGQKMPSLDILASYPWIVARKNSPMRAEWERLFADHELPQTPIECSSVMIIGRLLTEGDFLALLSPDQVGLQIKTGLLAQVGEPLMDSARSIGVTTRRSWRPTAVQRRFLELLSETTGGVGALEPAADTIANWV